MRYVLLLLFAALMSAPAHAQVRISDDPGGRVEAYIELYKGIRAAGYSVMIDGKCLSACTLVLSYVPRKKVCVTNRAVFGFHAAFDVELRNYGFFATQHYAGPNPKVTNSMMNSYPKVVQEWIRHQGGLTQDLKMMPASVLNGFYKRC
ncbi:hypothetical protein IT396_01540 [Candidatus Nomurabacteria bacterium]|nr:hypothetical protein [Candidatus Nomurabacteria bacterium]